MKITDIIKSKEAVLSFEVFPPKTDDKFESVSRAIDEIAALPGIQPKRARVIMAGALAIESVLATGGYRSLTVSENGLLIGLARTVVEAYEQGATTVGWLPKLS